MRAARAAAVVALGGLLYRWLVRERLLNWGAEKAEVEARLPGDELLEDADAVDHDRRPCAVPQLAHWF